MDLSPIISQAVQNAVDRHSHETDLVDYVVGPATALNAEGVPTIITLVTLRLNAAISGEYIVRGFFLDTPMPTPEQIEPPVADLLSRMRVERAEQMREAVRKAGELADEAPQMETQDQ